MSIRDATLQEYAMQAGQVAEFVITKGRKGM
jgi:hypothetical protein